MAQFRAVIRGQRGEASRLGSKSSGITAHVAGWDAGVRVEAYHSASGTDCFNVYATRGSNGGGFGDLLGHVDGKGIFHPAAPSDDVRQADFNAEGYRIVHRQSAER